MNIQDTLKELGLEVNSLPRILSQRVATVKDLVSKVALAEQEVSDDSTEESEAKLSEVKQYTEEYYKDAVEQLKIYKEKLDKKEKAESEKEGVVDAKPVEEKSSNMGALLIGGVLLVATLGAVNILRKR